MVVKVRQATTRDLRAIKRLADEHRHELGFVRLAALEEAVKERRIFIAINSPQASRPAHRIVGFVHFRCCKDGHATIYEIAVAPEWRGKGVGRKLVEAVIEQARLNGCTLLRLKCPIDLPANGFYARLGFSRVGIESGKIRPLAIWELPINPKPQTLDSPKWQF
ncbi:MAG: GNAT family N-acetyltransferase, partial [Armatimonadetes bacterium]|nr:GNAT family N-acetyltransferase [Armatimonadota bacterium]